MKTPIIETERLKLREIHADDVNEIFECWMQDEEVSRYMWWKASNNIADAQEFVEFELDQIDSEKWYRWIIEVKETGQTIGTCLVFYNEDDEKPHWDISYNLGKAFWGNGYVTEAMQEVMAFAVNELGMKECVTTYAKVNTASANVLHKLGFLDRKEILYECSGGELITDGVICCYHANKNMKYIAHYESPLGPLTLACDGTALTGLWFDGQKYFGAGLPADPVCRDLPVFEDAFRWLDLYFAGHDPGFTPALAPAGTAFRREVWDILLTIPYGRIMTYGEIAAILAERRGIPGMSAQAVGGAVGHNPISLIIPCHRVIGADGSLTGYAGGVERKQALLRAEKGKEF